MGQAVPTQHPPVVLRSQYRQLRALLAVAMVAVVGLSLAVVILAADESQTGTTSSAAPLNAPEPPGAIRYDGGPEEGTRGVLPANAAANAAAGIRYDGGPEEGTATAGASDGHATPAHDTRYDGGPEEGTRGGGH